MPKDARSRYWVRSLTGQERYSVRALSVEDAALRVIWRWWGRKAGIRRTTGVWRKSGAFQAFDLRGDPMGVAFLIETPSRTTVRQFPIKPLPHFPFDNELERNKPERKEDRARVVSSH